MRFAPTSIWLPARLPGAGREPHWPETGAVMHCAGSQRETCHTASEMTGVLHYVPFWQVPHSRILCIARVQTADGACNMSCRLPRVSSTPTLSRTAQHRDERHNSRCLQPRVTCPGLGNGGASPAGLVWQPRMAAHVSPITKQQPDGSARRRIRKQQLILHLPQLGRAGWWSLTDSVR